MLSQLMYSVRVAFGLGVLAAAISVSVGTLVGCLAAFYRDTIVDTFFMRLANFLMIFPTFTLLVALSGVAAIDLTRLAIIIGLLGGLGGITVVLKSRALGVTVKPFIDAARIAGGSDLHLIVRHVIPNVLPLSFLYMMFTVTSAIFAEAALSFFGLLPQLPGCSFSPRCGCADQVCHDSAPPIAEQRDQLTAACWHPLPVHTGNGHDAPGDISSAAVPGVAVLGVHRESDRSNTGNGPIVEVSHADKEFNAARGFFRRSAANVHAVDDASFEVRSGEALGIVGESGSGKTTLGRLLVHLNDATSGRIRVQVGAGLEAMADVKRRTLRRHVQMIFQDPYESLNPRMTIGDIIAEPLDVLDLQPRATRAERVARMLERVGLSPATHFLNRYPHELSGGQRQRVAIARAMVVEPRFVVADEPTSMLDVSVRAGIMELLLDLKRDLGVSYLYITHDLSVARYVCDRIAVMYRGKIVEIGESEELLQSPLHPYTRALIASVPVPDPTYRRPDPNLKRATSTGGAEDHCRFLARCPIASSRCAYEPHPALATNSTTGHLVSCYESERAAAVLST